MPMRIELNPLVAPDSTACSRALVSRPLFYVAREHIHKARARPLRQLPTPNFQLHAELPTPNSQLHRELPTPNSQLPNSQFHRQNHQPHNFHPMRELTPSPWELGVG